MTKTLKLNKNMISASRGGLSMSSASQPNLKVLVSHRKSSTTAGQTRNNLIVGSNTTVLGAGRSLTKLSGGQQIPRRLPKNRTANSQPKLQALQN